MKKIKSIDWEETPYNTKACVERFLNEGGEIKYDLVRSKRTEIGVTLTREIKSRYA